MRQDTGNPLITNAKYIFHSVYCGSTFLTQLFKSLPHLICHFEPNIWGELATQKHLVKDPIRWQNIVELIHRLFFEGTQGQGQPIIKLHNECINLASDLYQYRLIEPDHSAIFLFSSLDRFLISVLKSQERRAWCRSVLSRLMTDNGIGYTHENPDHLDDAQVSALLWIYHISTYQRFIDEHPGVSFPVLQDQVLYRDPLSAFARVADHLGVNLTATDLDRIEHSGVLTADAKQTDAPFSRDARTREDLQRQAQFRDQMARVMLWLAKDRVLSAYLHWPDAALRLRR